MYLEILALCQIRKRMWISTGVSEILTQIFGFAYGGTYSWVDCIYGGILFSFWMIIFIIWG